MSTTSHEKHVDDNFDMAQEITRRDEGTMAGELSEVSVIVEGEDRTTIFVWLLVSVSSISGLLFGELGF
jgi:MFS transporter, SP family, solute carrier family 2 (myo-inositol transporter), member 13